MKSCFFAAPWVKPRDHVLDRLCVVNALSMSLDNITKVVSVDHDSIFLLLCNGVLQSFMF